jgi:rubrerythrin
MKYYDFIYPYDSEKSGDFSKYHGNQQAFTQTVFQPEQQGNAQMQMQSQPQSSAQPPEQTRQEIQNQQLKAQRQSQFANIDQFVYPQNFPRALQLILDALNTEQEDAIFYLYLVNVAPTQEDKDIIINIQKDELNHYYLLRHVYTSITGQDPPEQLPFAGGMPRIQTYCQGLSTAFKGEIRDGQRYRKILFAMQDRVNINILTDIVADEIEHGSLYSFLYAKNSCGNQSMIQY